MPALSHNRTLAVAYKRILLATSRLIPSSSAQLPSGQVLVLTSSDKCGTAARSHQRTYATEAKYKPPKRRLPNPRPPPSKRHTTIPADVITPQLSVEELSSIFSQELFVFRSEVTANQVLSAMHLYPQLREINVLTPNDISNLARQLHNQYRLKQDAKEVLPHLKTVIEDLQQGAIPGHPIATLHIISALKDMQNWDEVNAFWKWAQEQGLNVTDARAYGAIIEALAYQGEPVPSLERLYSEAFERYSRMDPEVAKETGVTRIILLQGIITARLLNGEWLSAYEAFDLILRLYPTATPARVYELFIYERPIKEGFIVFLMACRAGMPPNPGVLTPLLKEIWLKHKDVKAMLRLVWAFVGAGGRPTFHHLNSIVKAMLLSYPVRPRDNTRHAKEEYNEGWKTMMQLIRQCIQSFVRLGIMVQSATFNTIISCGGKLGRGEVVVMGLRDMLAAGIRPTEVTYRALVNVAGDLRDGEQLEASWEMLVQAKMEKRARVGKVQEMLQSRAQLYREEEKLQSSPVEGDSDWNGKDWMALINSGVPLGKTDFVRDQLERFRHELPNRYYTLIWNWIANAQSEYLRELRVKQMKERGKKNKEPVDVQTTSTTEDEWDYLKAFKVTADAAFATTSWQGGFALASTQAPSSPTSFLEIPTPSIPSTDLPEPDHTIHAALFPEVHRLRLIFSHPLIQNYCPSSPNRIPIDFDLSEPPFPSLPDAELQVLYDEITKQNENNAKLNLLHYPIAYESEASQGIRNMSRTGLNLQQLRFENWKSINKLLFEAQCDEHRRIERIRREESGLGDGNSYKSKGKSGMSGFSFRFWKEDMIKKRIRSARDREAELLKQQGMEANKRKSGYDNTGNFVGSPSAGRHQESWKEEQWVLRKIIGGGGAEIKGNDSVGDYEDVTEFQNWKPATKVDVGLEKSSHLDEERSNIQAVTVDVSLSDKKESTLPARPVTEADNAPRTLTDCFTGEERAPPSGSALPLSSSLFSGEVPQTGIYPEAKEQSKAPTAHVTDAEFPILKDAGEERLLQAPTTQSFAEIKGETEPSSAQSVEVDVSPIHSKEGGLFIEAPTTQSYAEVKEELELSSAQSIEVDASPIHSKEGGLFIEALATQSFAEIKEETKLSRTQAIDVDMPPIHSKVLGEGIQGLQLTMTDSEPGVTSGNELMPQLQEDQKQYSTTQAESLAQDSTEKAVCRSNKSDTSMSISQATSINPYYENKGQAEQVALQIPKPDTTVERLEEPDHIELGLQVNAVNFHPEAKNQLERPVPPQNVSQTVKETNEPATQVAADKSCLIENSGTSTLNSKVGSVIPFPHVKGDSQA